MLRGVVVIFLSFQTNGPDVSGQAVAGLRPRALIERVPYYSQRNMAQNLTLVSAESAMTPKCKSASPLPAEFLAFLPSVPILLPILRASLP
jgi:hypothetical protein